MNIGIEKWFVYCETKILHTERKRADDKRKNGG